MICVAVIQAPVALILRVLASSMNSAPETSMPRTNTGTCKRMRGECRVELGGATCSFSLRIVVVSTRSHFGTKDLVPSCASWMPDSPYRSSPKASLMNQIQLSLSSRTLPCHVLKPVYPLQFLKCANGTLLPLTLGGPLCKYEKPNREIFYHFAHETGLTNGWTDSDASFVRRAESCRPSCGIRQRPSGQGGKAADGGRTPRESIATELARETVPGIAGIR